MPHNAFNTLKTFQPAAGKTGQYYSLPELAKKGNPNAASDAGAAALLLEAATHAALLNVAINLGGIDDAAFAADLKAESQRLSDEAVRIRERALSTVRSAF